MRACLPAVARELRRHAREAGAVAQRAVRARGGAALGGRRAARRSVQLRQRPLLPRQADLRAPLRAAARSGESDRRQRHARDHAERRAAQPGHAASRTRPCARSRAATSTRTTRATAGRSRRAPARCWRRSGPTATSCCSAASRRRSTSTCSRAIFGERLLFPIEFVGRGDMSRGGLLLRHARDGVELDYVPVAGAVAPRRAAAEAAAAPMADARRRPRSRSPVRRAVEAQPFAPMKPRARCSRATSDNVVARGRRQGGPPDQPAQALLARARAHQGRPAAVLRRRRRRAAAAPARPRDGDEALPARRRRRVLLHEARADAAAGVDRDLLDRARLRQRHRLPDDPGPAVAAVGDQPRLHRPEPVVRDAATTSIGPTTCTSISIPAPAPTFEQRASRRRWSCARRSTR